MLVGQQNTAGTSSNKSGGSSSNESGGTSSNESGGTSSNSTSSNSASSHSSVEEAPIVCPSAARSSLVKAARGKWSCHSQSGQSAPAQQYSVHCCTTILNPMLHNNTQSTAVSSAAASYCEFSSQIHMSTHFDSRSTTNPHCHSRCHTQASHNASTPSYCDVSHSFAILISPPADSIYLK